MLYLIGLGLIDAKDITLKGLEAARQCDECFVELYTSVWEGLRGLEELIGKKIAVLERKDIEEGLPKLLESARKKKVAIFVPGDPLAATTHIDILLEARKAGIKVKIMHNASIFSAIGETGLQLYKFGRTVTIPFSKQLEAVKDAIDTNQKAGLHTLLLLDIGMTVSEAVKMLMSAYIICPETEIVAVSRLGADMRAACCSARDLTEHKHVPAVLVLPGKLHFKEEEALNLLR